MKKNLPLIIGLAIPLLMIAFVAISIYVPSMLARPAYSFIYSVKDTYDAYGENYYIENGVIVKKTVPYPTSTPAYMYPEKRYPESKAYLYQYDVKNNSAKEISFDEAKKLRLVSSKISPDGYTLDQGSYNNGVFEIFGGNAGGSPDWYLRKGAVNKKVNLQFPLEGDRYYYYNNNFRFLGWIEQ